MELRGESKRACTCHRHWEDEVGEEDVGRVSGDGGATGSSGDERKAREKGSVRVVEVLITGG